MGFPISISATHKSMRLFCLFWPRKVQFQAKIYSFLTFMLINRNSNFVFFAYENTRKILSKVRYFSRNAEIFSQNFKFCFITIAQRVTRNLFMSFVRYFRTLFCDDITIIWEENIVYFFNWEKNLFWTNKKFVYLIFINKLS